MKTRVAATILAAGLLAAVPLGSAAQDPKKFDPNALCTGVEMSKVDAAIAKGVEFLKNKGDYPGHGVPGDRSCRSEELVLLTLIAAGQSVSDGKVSGLLKTMLDTPIERTYNSALQAMVLDDIDRIKYQPRIWQCAQHLVDNQCRNGQWSYGDATEAVKNVPTGTPTGTASGGGGAVKVYAMPGESIKKKPVRKLPVRRTKDGPENGDNSNSQYAALGLRAAFDAGISIPGDTVALALKWWKENQKDKPDKQREAVSTGGVDLGPPRGWCYHYDNSHEEHKAFGSMTGGAVASMVIYHYMLGNDWWRDGSVKSGLSWVANNFSVTVNPGSPCTFGNNERTQYHYYMYALERVGMLYGTVKIGAHAWYAEGAKELLGAQKEDGSWEGSDGSNSTWDTCFAILFLKRATAPVATGDRR